MKPKTMILMVVAVVCGLGASYMTSRVLAEREEKQPQAEAPPPPVPKVSILVARKMITANTLLKNPKDWFVEKSVVEADAPKEALRSWEGLQGKTMKRSLRLGDHVLLEDVQDGVPTLAVPPGMRAVGLRVTVDAIAAGFASLPGSRVDIYWNHRRGNSEEKSFSMRLLQNVVVLAADTQDGSGDGARAIPASVVTLALTPDDTQRVSLASEHGTLRLVLRDREDDSVGKDKVMTLGEVINGGKSEQAPEVVAVVPPVEQLPVPAPEAEEKPPQKPRRQHVVWFRSGDKQWKEVYEMDEHGNVITDDVARVEAPQTPAPGAPPAVQAPPAPAPVPPLNEPVRGAAK